MVDIITSIGWFHLKPTIDSTVSHMVEYFHDISRTPPLTLTNTETIHSVYKSNPVKLLVLAASWDDYVTQHGTG